MIILALGATILLTAASSPGIPCTRCEGAAQQSSTRASVLPEQSRGRDERKQDTPHLVLTTSSSETAAAPGARISLFLDIAPKRTMHVYAPEQKELIPISVSLEAVASFKAHPPKFPKAEQYFFEPLNETQLVYSKPFRIVQDVTIAATPAARELTRKDGATLTISGTLRYQACDDKVCYMPQSLPVSWTISLKPLGR